MSRKSGLLGAYQGCKVSVLQEYVLRCRGKEERKRMGRVCQKEVEEGKSPRVMDKRNRPGRL